jgi:hypothetical protein
MWGVAKERDVACEAAEVYCGAVKVCVCIL